MFTFESDYYRENCNTPSRPTRIKALYDVPKRVCPEYLPVRPIGLENVDIAAISLRACSVYIYRGYKAFSIIIEDIDRQLSLPRPLDLTKLLLPELRDFEDVFSLKEANKLPLHRLYNYDIKLIEGKTPLFRLLYAISCTKLQALKAWLEENLKKGFICPSSSAIASPVLFVKKSDRSLRFYIDYQALNNISIKDRYLLPLTKKSLNNLKGMKYFTKIDIISAFNNIQIKEG